MISQEQFQKNVRTIREALHMTQKDLAIKAMIKPLNRIGNIEEGRARVDLDEAIYISSALGAKVEQMMYEEAVVKIEFKFIFPDEP
jgi:transcriptional regulator with XRE-family HTH domain